MEPNKKKIVDLGILETDEVSGVKKISLVEEPAIMLDFQYFNKQKMDIDVAGLPQYVDQIPKKKKDIVTRAILAEESCDMDYSWTKDEYVVDTMIALAKEMGIKEEDLGRYFKENFATAVTTGGIQESDIPAAVIADRRKELRLYKYEGRVSSTTRDFCEQMMQVGLYYTEEAVKAMSNIVCNKGFGPGSTATYSIWDFKGGANCKHFWAKYEAYQKKNGDVMLRRIGPVTGDAGKKPFNMPNNGYVNARYDAIFSFAAEEQQILVGPAMINDLPILRIDENGKKYYVTFSAETIKEIALKYFKEGRVHELNTDHEENSAGAYIFESWIVETEDDKANTLYGYNVPIGSWMISVKVEDPETWRRVKAGELRGFSIEGILVDMEELEAAKVYERIKKILGTDI